MAELTDLKMSYFFQIVNHNLLVWFVQDITEEDIESELAVIHSQMAYIMQLQGRTEEALQLYNQVIKLKWVFLQSGINWAITFNCMCYCRHMTRE